MKRTLLTTIIFTALSSQTAGCTKDQSGSSSSSSSTTSSTSFQTDCGTVINNKLKNPVKPQDGTKGTVTVAGPNLLMMTTTDSKKFLIKLQSIGVPYGDAEQTGAMNLLKDLAQGDAYFFSAASNCSAQVASGATGFLGQVFTANGKSYSESLLNAAYARVDSDPCGGDLLTSCYNAIEDTATSQTAGELEAFLWKPVSDSNGKLAIHSSPSDTLVVIGGETGKVQGGGNGYAQLARFSKPGCGYGSNVRVQVTNSDGVPYRINGKDYLTVPNGCGRYCLRGGEIVSCPKN